MSVQSPLHRSGPSYSMERTHASRIMKADIRAGRQIAFATSDLTRHAACADIAQLLDTSSRSRFASLCHCVNPSASFVAPSPCGLAHWAGSHRRTLTGARTELRPVHNTSSMRVASQMAARPRQARRGMQDSRAVVHHARHRQQTSSLALLGNRQQELGQSPLILPLSRQLQPNLVQRTLLKQPKPTTWRSLAAGRLQQIRARRRGQPASDEAPRAGNQQARDRRSGRSWTGSCWVGSCALRSRCCDERLISG